jgi:cell division protein FtsZ
LITCGVPGVEYICANNGMDTQNRCSNHKTVQLYRNRQPMGERLDRCRISSELADAGFRSSIEGTDTLFIVAGMGGRTGTQVAPEMARIARSMGILTIAMVTMPFDYEIGRKRYAGTGLVELQASADCLIVMANDRLMKILGDDVIQDEVFSYGYHLAKTAIDGIFAETPVIEME